jgi:hypothetical protein
LVNKLYISTKKLTPKTYSLNKEHKIFWNKPKSKLCWNGVDLMCFENSFQFVRVP